MLSAKNTNKDKILYINQRPSAEHGPFEWPSSCRLLCRWSLIYCDSENDVLWNRVFNLTNNTARITPRPVPNVLKMRSVADECLVGSQAWSVSMIRLTIIPPRIAGIIKRHADVFMGWLYELKIRKRKYPSGTKPIILMSISRLLVSLLPKALPENSRKFFLKILNLAGIDKWKWLSTALWIICPFFSSIG